MNEFNLRILEADSAFYEGNCISLVVPTPEGMLGIWAGHSNMVAAISTGIIKFTLPDGERRHAAVSQGFIRVEKNDVMILAESVEKPEEIDERRVQAAIERANNELKTSKSIGDYKAVQAKLLRAFNRLNVKKKYTK